MRVAGIAGVRRAKRVRTTKADVAVPRHPDLVNREFSATAPIDNPLVQTVNGCKAELIYGPARSGPWNTVEDVELATLSWVYGHNTSRLHSYLADVPLEGFEATLSVLF